MFQLEETQKQLQQIELLKELNSTQTQQPIPIASMQHQISENSVPPSLTQSQIPLNGTNNQNINVSQSLAQQQIETAQIQTLSVQATDSNAQIQQQPTNISVPTTLFISQESIQVIKKKKGSCYKVNNFSYLAVKRKR